jgi:hypothetical protein
MRRRYDSAHEAHHNRRSRIQSLIDDGVREDRTPDFKEAAAPEIPRCFSISIPSGVASAD